MSRLPPRRLGENPRADGDAVPPPSDPLDAWAPIERQLRLVGARCASRDRAPAALDEESTD